VPQAVLEINTYICSCTYAQDKLSAVYIYSAFQQVPFIMSCPLWQVENNHNIYMFTLHLFTFIY